MFKSLLAFFNHNSKKIIVSEIKELLKSLEVYKKYKCRWDAVKNIECIETLLNVLKKIDEKEYNKIAQETRNKFTFKE